MDMHKWFKETQYGMMAHCGSYSMPKNGEFDQSRMNDIEGFKPSPYGLYETAATMNDIWGYCAWDQNRKDAGQIAAIRKKIKRHRY